jgi:hypothetical protein
VWGHQYFETWILSIKNLLWNWKVHIILDILSARSTLGRDQWPIILPCPIGLGDYTHAPLIGICRTILSCANSVHQTLWSGSFSSQLTKHKYKVPVHRPRLSLSQGEICTSHTSHICLHICICVHNCWLSSSSYSVVWSRLKNLQFIRGEIDVHVRVWHAKRTPRSGDSHYDGGMSFMAMMVLVGL